MNCSNAKDQLVPYVLRELRDAESDAIERHLSDCDQCRKSLSDLHQSISLVHDSIAPEMIDDQTVQFIKRAAVAPRSARFDHRVSVDHTAHPKSRSTPKWTLTALFAYAAGIVAAFVAPTNHRINPKTVTRPPADNATSPVMTLVSRSGYEVKTPDSQMYANVLYDPVHRQLHFYGRGLSRPPSGKRYAIALLIDGELKVVELLTPDSKGNAKCLINVQHLGEGIPVVVTTVDFQKTDPRFDLDKNGV